MRSRTKKVLIFTIAALNVLSLAGIYSVKNAQQNDIKEKANARIVKLRQESLNNKGVIFNLEEQKKQLEQQLQEEKTKRESAERAALARASRAKRVRSPVATGQPTVKRGCVAGLKYCWTDDVYDALAACESGMDPRKNTGNGFSGAFQFMPSTWRNLGPHDPKQRFDETGPDVAHNYNYAYQKSVVQNKIPISSWRRQFPACSRKLGV